MRSLLRNDYDDIITEDSYLCPRNSDSMSRAIEWLKKVGIWSVGAFVMLTVFQIIIEKLVNPVIDPSFEAVASGTASLGSFVIYHGAAPILTALIIGLICTWHIQSTKDKLQKSQTRADKLQGALDSMKELHRRGARISVNDASYGMSMSAVTGGSPEHLSRMSIESLSERAMRLEKEANA